MEDAACYHAANTFLEILVIAISAETVEYVGNLNLG